MTKNISFVKQTTTSSWFKILSILLVIVLATAIFMFRNRSAFQIPNFYAEDGTIIYNNILTRNPIEATTTLFNGYLIVGQYIVGYIAYVLSCISGGGLINLARWSAFSSCLFLGMTVSLPYILFRKQLGIFLSLITVILGAFVPMLNSDYAIIGTLGNLKFAFLYIAFLLILFRNLNELPAKVLLIIDALLLLCVLTDVTVLLLLPFGLWPYKNIILRTVTNKKLPRFTRRDWGFVSLCLSLALSSLYVALVYLHGIPSMPGYLDTPYQRQATIPLLQRSTIFALLFPMEESFNNAFTIALLATIIVISWLYRKADRMLVLFAAWAIFIGTVLFVVNRPGISAIFLNYANKGGPDQFFYTQNLIFLFTAAWLIRRWFKSPPLSMIVVIIMTVGTYGIWAIPRSTSFGSSKVVYQNMGTINTDLAKACREYAHDKNVIIQIYPTPTWQWQIDRSIVCERN